MSDSESGLIRKTTRMKHILSRPNDPVILLFPPTTREAKMLDALGFDTFYVGAGAVIGPILGRPDNGTITMTESVQISKYFVDAVDIPVWTDADACFGGIFQVQRAVEEYIKVGVAAITIEDQPYLGKRFGGMVGKEVLSLPDAVAKIRVAADTRNALDPDFQIIARCDALTAVNAGGLSESIERLIAYREAGADVLYLEGPESVEQIQAVREAVDGPLTCTPFNLPSELTRKEGGELGLCAVFYLQASRTVKNWFWSLYQAILQDDFGALDEIDRRILPTERDLGELANAQVMAGLRRFEEEYLPATQLSKYDGTQGSTVSQTAGMVEH